MKEDNRNYCCQSLQSNFDPENKLELLYTSRFRRYAILLRGHDASDQIEFCPWCGEQLPTSLMDTWAEEMIAQGFTLEEMHLTGINIPEKYRTDMWWKEKFQAGEILKEDDRNLEFVIQENGLGFCCNFMRRSIEARDAFICYLPYVREYGIAKRHCIDEMELIYYCPWCGKKLPESLRTEWNRQRWNPARKDIPVNDPYDEEFMTDRWWKIREED